MYSSNLLGKTKSFWLNLVEFSKIVSQRGDIICCRSYAKDKKLYDGSGCTKALVDLTPEKDPACPLPCERRTKPKKKGILHRMKLRMIEGGTNFGSKFIKHTLVLLCAHEVYIGIMRHYINRKAVVIETITVA